MSTSVYFLVANTILILGSLVGCTIWAQSNDIYTLGSAYGFYWFVSILSFVLNIMGYLYHFNITKTMVNDSVGENKKYIMFILSTIFVIFWLFASATVADYTHNCVYIKNTVYQYDNLYSYINYGNINCNGEIITTTFGFANFFLWLTIFIFSIKVLFFTYQINDTTIIPTTTQV